MLSSVNHEQQYSTPAVCTIESLGRRRAANHPKFKYLKEQLFIITVHSTAGQLRTLLGTWLGWESFVRQFCSLCPSAIFRNQLSSLGMSATWQ